MLKLLFSFRGRIGRLQYFLTVLGVVFMLVVLCMALTGTVINAGLTHSGQNLGLVLGLGLLLVGGALASLWIAFALQAKRIRDIGLDPIIVMPLLILFGIFDAGVAQTLPQLALGLHAVHQTLPGMAVNVCIGAALLFWPGRDAGDRIDAPPPPRLAPEPAPAASFAAPLAAAPMAAAPAAGWPAAARPTFGRRGS